MIKNGKEDFGPYMYGNYESEVLYDVKPPTSALSVQVAGSHYKNLKFQPIEYISANKMGFAQGSVVKYITRYKDKGGLDDLKKAKHFIDMIMQMEYGYVAAN